MKDEFYVERIVRIVAGTFIIVSLNILVKMGVPRFPNSCCRK